MIRIENLNYSIDGNTILENICMDFKENKITAITGPSGCGKTTLLNLMAGYLKPDSGSITISGTSIDDMDLNDYWLNTISLVFQNFGLIFEATIKENLFLAKPKGYGEKEIKEALNSVGLSDVDINKSITSLSGGQQQRVALAKVLLRDNPIIFADEPTGNLDYENAVIVLKELRKINKTTIIVTHDPVVLEYADEIIKV